MLCIIKCVTVSLVVLSCAGLTSCGANRNHATGGEQSGDHAAAQTRVFENSGKRLAGDYVMLLVRQGYGAGGVNRGPEASFRFFEDGRFEKDILIDGEAVKEEGYYLVGKGNELVLYVDKIAGELLEAARVEQYQIAEQSDTLIKIQSGAEDLRVLKRK